jgi:hypothetical protein
MRVPTSDGTFGAVIPTADGFTQLVYIGRKPRDPVDEERDRLRFEQLPFKVVVDAADRRSATLPNLLAKPVELIAELLLKLAHRLTLYGSGGDADFLRAIERENELREDRKVGVQPDPLKAPGRGEVERG